tara:strand:- start:25347 stop:26336 length:990 start_codon:yes stop_codon:yes gene_type:complete
MTELIAEVGLAHDGSLGIAHSYIDLAKSLDIDTIKFQMHDPKYESSKNEQFRINFSYEDNSRYEYWERTSFSMESWAKLIDHAKEKNINFLITPFSLKALDNISKLGLKRVKLGSAEVVDKLILNKALDYGFDMVISNGFCDNSIFEIVKHIKSKIDNLSVLECTSKYPSSSEDFNNKRYLSLLNERNRIGVGVSDHSGETSIAKYSIATGADILEAHIVFDKRLFGPDSKSSLEPPQWKEIVKFKKDILNIKSEKYSLISQSMKKTFSRSLAYANDIDINEELKLSHLESIKSNGMGESSDDYESFIGKKLYQKVKAGQLLEKKHFNK